MISKKIVHVDVALSEPPEYRPRYAVLWNKTVAEIQAFAEAHPRVFVFPFVDLPVEECPDYSALAPPDQPDANAPKWKHYVCGCAWYFGGMTSEQRTSAIDQLLTEALGSDREEIT